MSEVVLFQELFILYQCVLTTLCSFKVCFAIETMPVSVIPVGRALCVIPILSLACSTATVHLDMLAAPATLTEMNVALVRHTKF